MEILEKTQKMLEKHPLCDHCLGRQFALLGYGLDDERRGETLKLLLTMQGHQEALLRKKTGISLLKTLAVNGSFTMATEILKRMKKRVGEKKNCYLCEGRFDLLDDLVKSSVRKLRRYEYTTFLVGMELPTEIEEREDEFKAEFDIKHGESMRNEFSRDIGKRIAEITKTQAEYKKPDMVVYVNPFTKEIGLQPNPLHIAGRYRKLVRGIPQSKWFCSKCRGEGCPHCNWTGKMYPESIEEIIAKPTLETTQGEHASFHAAGREDIDARMLGRGRPFILEVKRPRKRFVDLKALAETINEEAKGKLEVLNLRLADRDAVRKLKKREMAEKVYKVVIRFDRSVSDEELELIEEKLTNAVISQQTPLRVLHRRADRTREKHIYKAKIKRLAPDSAEMRIRCQGGLYIKELITGDEGRTKPCVTEIVNAGAEPLELDVLSIVKRQ